jgi:hypothetical protein
MQGFSFASLILSYFLVGGGMFAGSAAAVALKVHTELMAYLLLAGGAFVGGFVAARASRGSTILEPAIGALAVIASIVGLAAGTALGRMIWTEAHDQTVRFIAKVVACGGGGALIGAFLSEKLLGEATRSSVPWILYTALSTFGASLLATLFGSIIFLAKQTTATSDQIATAMLVGVGAGCLLAGLAVGASARARPLLAAFIGGGAGVAGFWTMILRATQGSHSKEETAGIAVIAVGGCLVTLIGALLGWVAVGKRHAG